MYPLYFQVTRGPKDRGGGSKPASPLLTSYEAAFMSPRLDFDLHGGGRQLQRPSTSRSLHVPLDLVLEDRGQAVNFSLEVRTTTFEIYHKTTLF